VPLIVHIGFAGPGGSFSARQLQECDPIGNLLMHAQISTQENAKEETSFFIESAGKRLKNIFG
jgi:hypothetical protein